MKKFVLKRDESSLKENFNIDYSSLLNQDQLQAVYHDRGPALLIAGAGTGKTRTLIYRLARLIESGVDPRSIVLLTFTRRAAREMLERASSLTDQRCKLVQGGTFHFFCNQILHRFASYIGYPSNFTIMDSADSEELIHAIRSQKKYPKKEARFPKRGTLKAIFSTSVNKGVSVKTVVEDEYSQFLPHLQDIEELEQLYTEFKRANGVMDFDDLLVKTVELFEKHEEVRKRLNAEFKYIMVDEYQDTNYLQSRLVELLSRDHGNVMVVGDDAQSIYSFRGADFHNILSFPEAYPSAKIIKLQQNYRSTPSILNLANMVINRAQEKFEKELYTYNSDGELPGLVEAPHNRDQAQFISQMILQLREQEFALNEIGILFRNARDSFELELELNRKKIPFIKFGGKKFADVAHVKDVLAYLRVVFNPSDVVSWNRILLLIDGVGPKTAQDLVEWLREESDPLSLSTEGFGGNVSDKLAPLGLLLSDLKNKGESVQQMVTWVCDYYKPICQKRFDDHPKRIKDLDAFVSLASNYSSLEILIEEAVLDPIESTEMDNKGSKKDEAPLVLSTIHSAKGLEWRVVFLIQALDGIIPSGYSIKSPEQLDEELRLLYVAITRAKEMLLISYPMMSSSGQGEYFTKVSRFLEGIDEKLLEPWKIEYEAPQLHSIEDADGQNLLPDKS